MSISIKKETYIQNIKELLGGEFPEYHPESYIRTRVDQGFAFSGYIDEELAGFGIYSIWWGNCPHVELIKVQDAFQRQGLGRALMSAIKDDLKASGFNKVISSTEKTNPMGQAFHHAEGFSQLNSLQLPHGEEIFYELVL